MASRGGPAGDLAVAAEGSGLRVKEINVGFLSLMMVTFLRFFHRVTQSTSDHAYDVNNGGF